MPFIGLSGSGSSRGFGKNIINPPNWVTAAGSLGGDYTGRSSTFNLSAFGATSYSVISGSLATGHSLNSSTGAISGTASGPGEYQTNTYTITVRASNSSGRYADREFTYTITNRYVGYICGTAGEGGTVTITAPEGMIFLRRDFSSFGTPNGSCGAFTISGCNSSSSNSWNGPLNQNSASVAATVAQWGDPCYGTVKRMYVQWTYGPF